MMFRRPPWGYAVAYRAWTPLDLGDALIAWWSAERTDLITMDGSNRVSSWIDAKAGFQAVQSTQADMPVWGATGFGTRPAITGDGVSQWMAGANGVPVAGATPCEEWYAVDQMTLAAATTSTHLGSSGGSVVSTSRGTLRIPISGTNRARASDSNNSVTETTVDFTGRHVTRTVATGTTLRIEVDGASSSTVASVPAIATTRLRFFCSQASTPGQFSNIAAADRLFTTLLSAMQAAQMYRFLTRGV